MAQATSSSLPARLVLVGAGRMGGALLEGWLSAGLDPAGAAVLDPSPAPRIAALGAARGIAPEAPPGGRGPPRAGGAAGRPAPARRGGRGDQAADARRGRAGDRPADRAGDAGPVDSGRQDD